MKDDRLYEIVSQNAVQEPEVSDWMYVIRQALAERDAEIVDFARHEARVGEIDGWVSVADLLAFLEGKP